MRILLLAAVFTFGLCETVRAFCGFYVAQEGGTPFNEASKVVLARHDTTTTITMASDVSGNPQEFALVIPVPIVIQQDQVRVVPSATVDHLDEYTTPRLVEYHDGDPCMPLPVPAPRSMQTAGAGMRMRGADALGVKVEAEYSVGEYDIQVLSAADSGGLIDYLNARHYRIPEGAGPVIGSYLRQGMRFFVARVNMGRVAAASGKPVFLRPIQVSYASPKFMLPIRLGTVNAKGKQDMIVLGLSDRGRIETTNYRTRRMPTGIDIPLYLRTEFGPFYRAVFDRQVADAGGAATFLEYAWDLGPCDPCSAKPFTADELRDLGISWGATQGGPRAPFVTRLHVRYDQASFPEDLALQETADRETFQVRFVVTHPFTGKATCEAGKRYAALLPDRWRKEARNAVEMTNWPYDTVRQHMEQTGAALPQETR